MLNNKIIVITGAGSGLGQALAVACCKQGATVVGVGRHEESLQATQQKIANANCPAGAVFDFFECDVSEFDDLASIVDNIHKKYQRIDVVFNNAAVYQKINFLLESAADFQRTFAINVLGVANLCKLVLPEMILQKSGRIINVGSFADISPIAESAAYSASKGALHALSKGIAVDIADTHSGVQVLEWIPGCLNTQMSGFTGIPPEQAAEWGVELISRPLAKNHAIFLGQDEWMPAQSFKARVLAKLMFWRK